MPMMRMQPPAIRHRNHSTPTLVLLLCFATISGCAASHDWSASQANLGTANDQRELQIILAGSNVTHQIAGEWLAEDLWSFRLGVLIVQLRTRDIGACLPEDKPTDHIADRVPWAADNR